MDIRNTHRSVGGRIAGVIAARRRRGRGGQMGHFPAVDQRPKLKSRKEGPMEFDKANPGMRVRTQVCALLRNETSKFVERSWDVQKVLMERAGKQISALRFPSRAASAPQASNMTACLTLASIFWLLQMWALALAFCSRSHLFP